MTKLKIKRPWREVMQMPYSKAKQQMVSRKSIESRRRRWEKYRAEMFRNYQEMARDMKAEAKRKRRKLAQRVCRDCSKRWPAAEPFFVIYEKETRAGRRTYVGRLCKFCQNQRRRAQRNGKQ